MGNNAVKNTDYLFSTSRIRSIENNLLDAARIEKMLDAKTVGEAIRVLYECGYEELPEESSQTDEFEGILVAEQKKTYEMIKQITPKPECFDFLLYCYDYHNIKTVIKCEFANLSSNDMLVHIGKFPAEKIKSCVVERAFSPLTDSMASAARNAIEDYAKNKDPQMIDIIVDKACFEDMALSAAKIQNTFVSGYVRLSIDTINVKTFVRMRHMKKQRDFFQKAFISGGNIGENLFAANYDESSDVIAERLEPFGLCEAFKDGVEALSETGKFTVLERFLDNLVMEYVKAAKYISYGVEPIVAYLVAKENEIKTARIILSGKKARLDSESVKERLRTTYV